MWSCPIEIRDVGTHDTMQLLFTEDQWYCQLAEKQNLWHIDGMKTNTSAPNYKGFRFPPEIISHAVWLYFRFSLSYRDVEELLAQRGARDRCDLRNRAAVVPQIWADLRQ